MGLVMNIKIADCSGHF